MPEYKKDFKRNPGWGGGGKHLDYSSPFNAVLQSIVLKEKATEIERHSIKRVTDEVVGYIRYLNRYAERRNWGTKGIAKRVNVPEDFVIAIITGRERPGIPENTEPTRMEW